MPKRQRLTRGHQPAMPYQDVPAFVARLRASPSTSALAMEFLIHTAARKNEVEGAVWGEFVGDLWTVPAARMKGGKRPHRVPLPPRALEILADMRKIAGGGDIDPGAYVFPGAKPGKPLSVMALDMLLRRMKVEFTTHGFRSSFRDWCGEETAFPREVAEEALAHSVGNAVERAYRHGEALEKRRDLMAGWADYLKGAFASNVVPLRRA